MFKYSSVILVLTFVIFAFAHRNEDLRTLERKLGEVMDKCVSKTNVTGEQLDELGTFKIPKEIPPTCFLACMAKNFDIMDTNNKFSASSIKNLLEPLLEELKKDSHYEEIPDEIIEVVNKCTKEQTDEKDECIAAKKAMECAVTTGKRLEFWSK